jgi:glycerol-3-phosphate responsive antiterminator
MGDTLYASPAVVNELKQLNRLFVTACDQIKLLNQEILGVKARYIRAQRDNKKAFLYSLRL